MDVEYLTGLGDPTPDEIEYLHSLRNAMRARAASGEGYTNEQVRIMQAMHHAGITGNISDTPGAVATRADRWMKRYDSLPADDPRRAKLKEFVTALYNHVTISGIGKHAAKGKGKGLKKVLLSPGRNAFLSLVDLNVRGLASHMNKAMMTKNGLAKIKAKWEKMGGKWDKLSKVIAKGATKKALLGDKQKKHGMHGLAAAAPVIAGMAALLKVLLPKSSGEDGAAATEDVNALTDDAKQEGGTAIDPSTDPNNEIVSDGHLDNAGGTADSGGMGTGAKVAIGAGVLLVAYNMFGKKKRA